jgi:hypothetical protein
MTGQKCFRSAPRVPKARFAAQVHLPGFSLGDETVDPHHEVIDRWQGSGDVKVLVCPVSEVRGVNDAGPSAGKTVGRAAPGKEGAKPGQLGGQVAGGAGLCGLLDLRRPCERGRAAPLHLILADSGEADEIQG